MHDADGACLKTGGDRPTLRLPRALSARRTQTQFRKLILCSSNGGAATATAAASAAAAAAVAPVHGA